MVQVKRVYEGAQKADGYRIRVDRLWPRGESKEKAAIDFWAKDVAPSTGIRTEFHHDPQRFPAFKREYLAELVQNPKAAQFVSLVKEKLKEGNVTFVYAAKDETYNHVVILKSFVQEQLQ